MRKMLRNILYCVFVFTIFGGNALIGQDEELFQERLRSSKKQYYFDHWGTESEKIIPGLAVSEKILPQLARLKKVWPEDDYRIEKIKEITFTIIRKWWKLGDDQFEVTMVVCPTFEAARGYLISNYAWATIAPNSVKKLPGVGNICLETKETKEVDPTYVDFIRHNVIMMMWGKGSIKKKLCDFAGRLDNHLKQKKPVARYSELEELPLIKTFYSNNKQIKQGERERLYLGDKNPRLRYFWEMSGGTVEENSQGDFFFCGTKMGKHKITLTVVNELGLCDAKSIEIEVQSNR